jgi:hypothetical protein
VKYLRPLIFALLLFSLGCRTDYDIEEVASAEYMGSHDHDAEDHHHETEDHQDDSEDTESQDIETAGISQTDMHIHSSGERNHGTQWFFNQPWAAEFIWGKILRDSVILCLIAASVLLLSAYRRKHR